MVPMVRKYYVEKKELFSEEELMDIAAISQSAPGAIAINLTALAGYRVLGWLGAGVSCMAAIIPPLLIFDGCFYLVRRLRRQRLGYGGSQRHARRSRRSDGRCNYRYGQICSQRRITASDSVDSSGLCCEFLLSDQRSRSAGKLRNDLFGSPMVAAGEGGKTC